VEALAFVAQASLGGPLGPLDALVIALLLLAAVAWRSSKPRR
jgi:hypothetical protein